MDKCAKTHADVWHSDVWRDSFICARHATSPAILSGWMLTALQISPDDRTAATHCNSLQHTATHRNTLQHCRLRRCHQATRRPQHTAAHRNTPQHTTTHHNTQRRRPCRCQHFCFFSCGMMVAIHCNSRNTPQHTATLQTSQMPSGDTTAATTSAASATTRSTDALSTNTELKRAANCRHSSNCRHWGRCHLIAKRCPTYVCVHKKILIHTFMYMVLTLYIDCFLTTEDVANWF